jgi:hypothetical protein
VKPIVIELRLTAGSRRELADQLFDKLHYGRAQLQAGKYRLTIERSDDKGYGTCPVCKEVDPPFTKRERRPNGDTTCGKCNRKSPSSAW